MPTFCRHNRLIANCPICTREQSLEMRPVVSPGGRPAERPVNARPATPARRPRSDARAAASSRGSGVRVRRLVREASDDFRSDLVPAIKSAPSAARLADELAFAATRLDVLATAPPGLYAEVADPAGEVQERIWLAFLIALIGPAESADPFRAIAAVRVSWASGEVPAFAEATSGPRGVTDPVRAARTATAYRAWAHSVGDQPTGLAGEASWTPERRFDRGFERLGSRATLERVTDYDLLVTLGRLGVLDVHGARLHLGGSDRVTLGAKRILGIGDPLLLERRAAELAEACAVPLEALDLGFDNWERGRRSTGGLAADAEPDPDLRAAARAALGLD